MKNRTWHRTWQRMLRRNWMRTTVVITVVVGMACLAPSCGKKETVAKPKDLQPVRIGWQVAWATQGQIAMALQRTTALESVGLEGDFKSFTYGAPLSEAALAAQLDVAFVGDQPAVNLLSRSKDWRIVARLMDFRVAIVVPPDSPVKLVADLKGKTLGIPFGASTHRVALKWLKEAGLDPAKDLTILNIDILEQSDTVKAAGGNAWPKVDAFASWDHHIALYEKQRLAKILKSGTAVGVVLMSKPFIDEHASAAAAFVAAFKQGYYYYATHQPEVDKWFAEAAGGTFDVTILKTVAEVEPNMKATRQDQIRIEIGQPQIATLQQAADFALAQGLIKSQLQVDKSVSSETMERSEGLLKEAPATRPNMPKP